MAAPLMDQRQLTDAIAQIQTELISFKKETIATYDAIAARITNDESDSKKILETANQNKEDLKKVFVSIKEDIQPIIDLVNIQPPIQQVLKQLDAAGQTLEAKMQVLTDTTEQKIQVLRGVVEQTSGSINAMQQAVNTIQQGTVLTDVSVTNTKAVIDEIRNQLLGYQNTSNERYASMQGQMAMQISAQHSASAGGVGGGPRKGEPLVTHKLFAPKERLAGNETFEAIDDWYEEM